MNLNDVKVGDRLIYTKYAWTSFEAVVSKVTAKYVRCEDGVKFRRETGFRVCNPEYKVIKIIRREEN